MQLQDLYNKTIDFAANAHKDQKVPGKEYSYVVHLSNVAMELFSAFLNTGETLNFGFAIQCALLHDTIEDTGVKYEEIIEIFGKEIADGVLALTKDKNIADKSDSMKDSH